MKHLFLIVFTLPFFLFSQVKPINLSVNLEKIETDSKVVIATVKVVKDGKETHQEVLQNGWFKHQLDTGAIYKIYFSKINHTTKHLLIDTRLLPKKAKSSKEAKPSEEAKSTADGEQQFQLQKIYLKDTSFETPNSPEVFTENWEPDVNVELQSAGKPITDDVHEVVLTVTITAKVGDNTAYLVEVHQAGVFTLTGFNENDRAQMLGSYCPNILFPYAREAISDLIGKGGFPQLLLAPVNFDALYAQHLQQQQEKNTAAEEPIH